MEEREIRIVFNNTYKSKNFITPDIISYGETPKHLYELSQGKFLDNNIYGVTVLTKYGNKTELSKSFDSLKEAKQYIQSIN